MSGGVIGPNLFRNGEMHYFSTGGETSYFSNGLPDRITLRPSEWDVDVPFVYSLLGNWYACVKRSDGRLDFYEFPRPSWWTRFRRWLP